MEGVGFKTRSLVPAILMVAALWSPTAVIGQSIDQMIWEASESVDQFDQLADINGDRVLHDMDMMLTIEQYIALMSGDDSDDTSTNRKKRKAINYQNYRWENKVIPYNIDPRGSFTTRDRDEIKKAIYEWEQYTCLDFRQKGSRDRNYVNFDNGNGCYSYVGMMGGMQTIGLARGCRYKGVVIHEIGHAVGFHHEQNRPDRDEHVTIMFQNIPEKVRYNFKKYPKSAVNTMDVPYDYGSIMHYGGTAFSINNQYTIKTKRPEFQSKIGNREGLSFYDIKLANLMYKCHLTTNQCPDKKCPSHAYLSKHCKCMCPGDPVKECDDSSTGGTRTTRPTQRPVVTTTPKPDNCMDGHRSCPSWAQSSQNYCRTNTYVKTYCKKSCNNCDNGGRVTNCVDLKDHCSYWKERGYCTSTYVDFMEENCAKTCGSCSPSKLGADGNGGKSNRASWLVLLVLFPFVAIARLL